ncbi:hypothetical protein BGZ60DRAFT_524813 [Tricladium varicosporioides]|nr:hypothetical protein BGZ60DRAFT_524813 [Hymenoscyphus varicosporioides]
MPSDCLSVTNQWLFGSRTTCQPLTGDYYSPAICPTGWTAAYSRPIIGSYGPPEEPGETAMFCCPWGMNSIQGTGCGAELCASTSIYSGSTGLEIGVLQFRTAIQIRWASSDLSILETHPLTPGMTLNRPRDTSRPIPPLDPAYKVSIGVAFLPLIIAMLSAIWGCWLLYEKRRKRRNQKSAAPSTVGNPQDFRPKTLSWPFLTLLFGFAMTVFILIEISCHTLPVTAGPIQLPNIKPRSQVTKVHRTNLAIVSSDQINATSSQQPSLECSIAGNSTVSTIITKNHGTSITTQETYASASETVCQVSGTPISLPSCYEPPTAPRPEKFLSFGNTSSTFQGEYFVTTMLPTLLASLFAIPWKIINLHAISLEPFHKMSKPGGLLLSSSILRNYKGTTSLFGVLPAITTVLAYASSIITPLAAEAWILALVGNCAKDESKGCTAITQAVPQVIRTIEALLVIILLLIVFLVITLRGWVLGVVADPRSIAGIATLAQSPSVYLTFSALPTRPTAKDMRKRLQNVNVSLSPLNLDQSAERGMVILGQRDQLNDCDINKLPRGNNHPMPVLGATFRLVVFVMFLAGFNALIMYYRLTGGETHFENFMSSQSFGPRFIFTLCGIIINFVWVSVFRDTVLLTPYYAMSLGKASASGSILISYAGDPYTVLIPSLLRCQFLLAATALTTILSDFLPLLLSNIPFNRTTTWNAHVVSSWISVAILSFMIFILLALMVTLIAGRPKHFVDIKLLRKYPIASILLMLVGSSKLMINSRGLSNLGTKERNKRIREMNFRYHLGEGGSDSAGVRTSVKVSLANKPTAI